MRHIPDQYVHGNPFLEPVSFDAVAVSYDENGAAEFLEIPDPASGAEEQLAEAETGNIVRDFVAGLGDRDRIVVQSMFWDNRTQADVARAMGVSPAAVSKRLARILSRARTQLGFLREDMVLH